MNIVVLISGSGTNLQEIIDNVQNGNLNANISAVISNKPSAYGLERASRNNINTFCYEYSPTDVSRKDYDEQVGNIIDRLNCDLIVLAGWMHIFAKDFTDKFGHKMINLHPAYPGQFPGKDGIGDAFRAYASDKTVHAGIMVHKVVEEIDAGEVITKMKIPIYETDTLESLTQRVKYHEKPLLIQAIQETLLEINNKSNNENIENNNDIYPVVYKGKVRDIYDIGFGKLLMKATDRLSSFDRAICDVPNKGTVLNSLSKWWFEQTRHIVPNHMLHSYGNMMVVKHCSVIPLEIVVRGYITGSTQTSLWTHYEKGDRVYCGIPFPDGLQRNQKLSCPVVTPTTKGIVDVPISAQEILNQKILTESEWNYIHDTALKLFKFGQMVANSRDFLLVDTKYEFGYGLDGTITLVDEIHTCDSSRYWRKSTYDERFSNGMEPERLDKDIVRNWVKSKCNPYTDPIPEIPQDVISGIDSVYTGFYNELTETELITNELNVDECVGKYFSDDISSYVIIVAGSTSDHEHISTLVDKANKLNLYTKVVICSAHKNTKELVQKIDAWNALKGKKIVFVAVAGRSNALGAVLASNLSNYSVISCPPFKDKTDYNVNINSSLQNPSNVPALTMLDPGNAMLSAQKILGKGQ